MPFFHVNDLTKHFGDTIAVKGISFGLEKGHCVALLGPNGAGKTTVLNMISGLLKPTKGTIKYENEEPNADIRQYIGYLPQHPVFHDWMTGEEFLNYVGKLAHVSKPELKERTAELLELVGISDAKHRRTEKYSGGMKQRLGIAQAIIHRPKLLLLDEPVSALDPFGRREVLEMIRKLKEDTTILFSTHVLNDAEEVSDDVIIIHQGEVKEADSLGNLREKHQQAMIFVQTNGHAEKYLNDWDKWDIVHEIYFEGSTAKIVVNNLEKAKTRILQEIVHKNIPILKFEIGRTTLEELFIKVVRG